jgi:hypothetical protein
MNLSNDIHLQSNKLLIKRYLQPKNSDLGEVVQLDASNNQLPNKTNTYFVIRVDSLLTTANTGLPK